MAFPNTFILVFLTNGPKHLTRYLFERSGPRLWCFDVHLGTMFFATTLKLSIPKHAAVFRKLRDSGSEVDDGDRILGEDENGKTDDLDEFSKDLTNRIEALIGEGPNKGITAT